MGGASTEMDERSTTVVVECASFDPVAIARASRRHKLSSEASKRFERGVDQNAAYAAAHRAALLVEWGGGRQSGAETVVGADTQQPISSRPRCRGRCWAPLPAARVVAVLQDSGVAVDQVGDTLVTLAVDQRPLRLRRGGRLQGESRDRARGPAPGGMVSPRQRARRASGSPAGRRVRRGAVVPSRPSTNRRAACPGRRRPAACPPGDPLADACARPCSRACWPPRAIVREVRTMWPCTR
jgi:hypothetical protein